MEDTRRKLLKTFDKETGWKYCLRPSAHKTLQWGNRRFRKVNAAKAGAKIGGMDNSLWVEVLQVRRADAGYLIWYFAYCRGMFQAAWSAPARQMCWGLCVFARRVPSLLLLYAKSVLRADSDETGSEEAVGARDLLVRKIAQLLWRSKFDTWTVPPGLVLVQIFTAHIMHFPENTYKDATLFEKYRRILLSQWSNKRRGCSCTMNVGKFLARDRSAQGRTMKKTVILHPPAGLASFVSRTIGKGEGIGCYYGSPVYANMAEEQHKKRM